MSSPPLTFGGFPVYTSVNVPPGQIIVVQTRWHEDDLVGGYGELIKHRGQGDVLELAIGLYRAHAGTYRGVDLVPGMEGAHATFQRWGLLSPRMGNARGYGLKMRPHDRVRAYWSVAPPGHWDTLEAIHRMGGWLP